MKNKIFAFLFVCMLSMISYSVKASPPPLIDHSITTEQTVVSLSVVNPQNVVIPEVSVEKDYFVNCVEKQSVNLKYYVFIFPADSKSNINSSLFDTCQNFYIFQKDYGNLKNCLPIIYENPKTT